MSKPAISVLLPTYNRPELIGYSIKSVLNQDFDNYELIILDDYGKDNTEEVVKKFNDPHITFIKNKKNLGYGNNLKKGFDLAKGKYIFLLGDDDIIVKKNTFSTVFQYMEKYKAGYAQMGYLYYDDDFHKPSSINHLTDKLLYVPPSEDILIKTVDWHFGCISGSVFRKDLVNTEDIIDDVWWPYYKVIYKSILKHGCIYFGEHYIDAKVSFTGLIAYLDIKKNKGFYMDRLFEIFKEFDSSPERYQQFIKNRLDTVPLTMPGIKFYTSNHNLKEMAKSVVRHRPAYAFELYFWKQFLFSYFAPKIILNVLRRLRSFIGTRQMNSTMKGINLEKHLKEVLK